jgi:hypothetical protein
MMVVIDGDVMLDVPPLTRWGVVANLFLSRVTLSRLKRGRGPLPHLFGIPVCGAVPSCSIGTVRGGPRWVTG